MTSKVCHLLLASNGLNLKDFDGLIVPVRVEKEKDKSRTPLLGNLPKPLSTAILAFIKKSGLKPEHGQILCFDYSLNLRVALLFLKADVEMFALLNFARETIQRFKGCGLRRMILDARTHPNHKALIESFASAVVVRNFHPPKITKHKDQSKQENHKPWEFFALVNDESESDLQDVISRAEISAHATNQVRELSMRGGNDLTPESYVQYLSAFAEKHQLKFEFWNEKKLKTMNAGAFLAVCQGSSHRHSGIVKLVYKPKKTNTKKLVLVGKGVTYDTGGTNLKPARSMFGMHTDMGGSALAVALTWMAATQKWPYQVTTYLAIADNAIGENAYRPNDIVFSAKGKSIEVVHTDAEGRMLLADTLHFASKEKPDLMLDFATLTGACVGAIGSSYSGAFTNRPEWFPKIMMAGRLSGERVWPFPMDDDFGDCLKSEVADIKQCRLSGGVDHIEAAYFLNEFVDQDVPWLHLDLSSSQNTGGLAHVDTEITGFGVRFASQMIGDLLGES